MTAVRTNLPESSLMAPVAIKRIPDTVRANADTRGLDIPGAKVGPISKPMAQPTRQDAIMRAKPAWPKLCWTAVGCARMTVVPSTAKRAMHTHGIAIFAAGLATRALIEGNAPVVADSAWRARSGVRKMMTAPTAMAMPTRRLVQPSACVPAAEPPMIWKEKETKTRSAAGMPTRRHGFSLVKGLMLISRPTTAPRNRAVTQVSQALGARLRTMSSPASTTAAMLRASLRTAGPLLAKIFCGMKSPAPARTKTMRRDRLPSWLSKPPAARLSAIAVKARPPIVAKKPLVPATT